jgi:hypothetical protein
MPGGVPVAVPMDPSSLFDTSEEEARRRAASDFFTESTWAFKSVDDKVALLNNYWHHLQREASSQGLMPGDPVYDRVLLDMDNWWTWKTKYDDAILRRAFTGLAWIWGGGTQAELERELGRWKDRWIEDMEAVIAAKPSVAPGLINRGVDPEIELQEFPSKENNRPLIIGLGVVVLLVGFGAWASFKARGFTPKPQRRSPRKAYKARYRKARPSAA